MEANELRIGNFVLDKDGNIESIFEISKYGDLYRINELDPDYFKSITLTEEWLLKFGFVKDFYRINDQSLPERFIEDDIWRLEDEIHLFCKDGIWWLMDEYDLLLSLKREMKGVHDLQNLFFALKGKELTLK